MLIAVFLAAIAGAVVYLGQGVEIVAADEFAGGL